MEIDAGAPASAVRLVVTLLHSRSAKAPAAMSVADLMAACELAYRWELKDVLDRLALEARRHLTYSAAGAAQIAYDLGFEDPAYFSRFFKRRCPSAPWSLSRTIPNSCCTAFMPSTGRR